MKSKWTKKLERWKNKAGSRRKIEKWGALKGWEGARSGAEYVNLDGSGNLEVVQTGYTYIFQIPNILSRADRKEEEQRIKAGLAAGVLMIDGSVQLLDVKPRLEVLGRRES